MRNKLFNAIIWTIILSVPQIAYGQPNAWETLIRNGDQAVSRKLYAEGERAFRDALALAQKFVERDPRRAATLITLADILNLQGKRDEAEALARQSLEALEKATAGPISADTSEAFYRTDASVMILDKAASIFVSLKKYSEAEPLYKRAISLREEWAKTDATPPAGNKDFLQFLAQATTNAQVKLADAYQNLAALYLTERRFDEAQTLYITSSKALEAEFGRAAPPFAASQSRLATLYALQGKYEKAAPLYARAVTVFEKTNWLDKAEAAITFENYVLLLRKTGRETEAARMLENARAIRARLQTN